MNSEIRESDIAARCGGDEFAVLLDQADEAGAHVHMDRVKNRNRATALFVKFSSSADLEYGDLNV